MSLKQLRESKKLTAREVGRRMGVSHVQVGKIEKASDARISTLESYALALGASLQEVLDARKKSVQESYQTA